MLEKSSKIIDPLPVRQERDQGAKQQAIRSKRKKSVFSGKSGLISKIIMGILIAGLICMGAKGECTCLITTQFFFDRNIPITEHSQATKDNLSSKFVNNQSRKVDSNLSEFIDCEKATSNVKVLSKPSHNWLTKIDTNAIRKKLRSQKLRASIAKSNGVRISTISKTLHNIRHMDKKGVINPTWSLTCAHNCVNSINEGDSTLDSMVLADLDKWLQKMGSADVPTPAIKTAKLTNEMPATGTDEIFVGHF